MNNTDYAFVIFYSKGKYIRH